MALAYETYGRLAPDGRNAIRVTHGFTSGQHMAGKDARDVGGHFSTIRARVLYVLSRTDKLFPPSIAPDVMDGLGRTGVNAKYLEIDSEFGHTASGPEWAKWRPTLKAFVDSLDR